MLDPSSPLAEVRDALEQNPCHPSIEPVGVITRPQVHVLLHVSLVRHRHKETSLLVRKVLANDCALLMIHCLKMEVAALRVPEPDEHFPVPSANPFLGL